MELRNLFAAIDLSYGRFNDRAYTRLKQLQYLMDTLQIDDQLYWRRS